MNIKALRSWTELKTNQNFIEGNKYEVTDSYGERMIAKGHAEEVKTAKVKKADKTDK